MLAKGVWALIKWFVGTLCGVIAYVELAPRYEQLRSSGWSSVSLPLSSTDIIGITAIAVGAVLIGSDILSRLSGRKQQADEEPQPRPKPEPEMPFPERRSFSGLMDAVARDDFRNSVATEMRSILKKFSDPLNNWDIAYPSWNSKVPESKIRLLGKEDYLGLKAVYDAIEERNRYFTRRLGMDVAEVDPLNLKCVEAFWQAYTDIPWLKTESDIDSLLAKARKAVGLR